MRLRSLQKIAEGLGRPYHDSRPSLQTFADLSVDELARQLNVHRQGEEHGSRELPASNSTSFDETEHAIVERIFAERKAAHQVLRDQLETYSDRLTSLDFHGRFLTIQQAAPLAVSEFIAEARLGRDELFDLRRGIVEQEDEREEFKRFHKLRRAPQLPTTAATLLKISLLVFLFIFETYVNGLFLAKSNVYGIIGGIVEALVFAVLNVLVSFFLGLGGVRQLNHSSLIRKFFGLVALLFWIAFALVLNLALAHYREISGAIYEDAGLKVIGRLVGNTFGLVDIKSWLFFAIGLVFSIAALADGIMFTDPFPGYAALEERVKRSHQNYIQRKAALTSDLKSIRDNASQDMEDAQTDLRKRRAEYTAILQGRERLLRLYEEHQAQLERAGNALLSRYRSSNKKRRSTAPPPRFEEVWLLERSAVAAEIPESLLYKNLDIEIRESNNILREQIIAIHRAFDEAIERYRQIDDLVPEPK